jgi:large subunit ribosomal protein L2
LQVGATVVSGDSVAPDLGNALQMRNMPWVLLCITWRCSRSRAELVRSAGSSAQLSNKEEKYAVLKMPSGELRKVLSIVCNRGVVSNSDHSLQSMGKAGRNVWKGIRPRTRGVAMNPVDHPMGGGEGRASGGQPRSRTGQYSEV